jgi:hypothetical protein
MASRGKRRRRNRPRTRPTSRLQIQVATAGVAEVSVTAIPANVRGSGSVVVTPETLVLRVSVNPPTVVTATANLVVGAAQLRGEAKMASGRTATGNLVVPAARVGGAAEMSSE